MKENKKINYAKIMANNRFVLIADRDKNNVAYNVAVFDYDLDENLGTYESYYKAVESVLLPKLRNEFIGLINDDKDFGYNKRQFNKWLNDYVFNE